MLVGAHVLLKQEVCQSAAAIRDAFDRDTLSIAIPCCGQGDDGGNWSHARHVTRDHSAQYFRHLVGAS
jgi:hypothetical protein